MKMTSSRGWLLHDVRVCSFPGRLQLCEQQKLSSQDATLRRAMWRGAGRPAAAARSMSSDQPLRTHRSRGPPFLALPPGRVPGATDRSVSRNSPVPRGNDESSAATRVLCSNTPTELRTRSPCSDGDRRGAAHSVRQRLRHVVPGARAPVFGAARILSGASDRPRGHVGVGAAGGPYIFGSFEAGTDSILLTPGRWAGRRGAV